MDGTKLIQVAVAKADVAVTTALRWLPIAAILTLVLLAALIAAWYFRPDPYWIDYDAPGIDITSEGPDDGDPWYDEGR